MSEIQRRKGKKKKGQIATGPQGELAPVVLLVPVMLDEESAPIRTVFPRGPNAHFEQQHFDHIFRKVVKSPDMNLQHQILLRKITT